MKTIVPIHLILILLVFFTCNSYSQQAKGLYAYVDFRGDSDSRAKVAQFTSAGKNGGGYNFRIPPSGRLITIDSSKYRGAVYYPSLEYGISVQTHKNKLNELKAFAKRFPDSSRYLTNMINKLSLRIQQMEKSAEVNNAPANKDDSTISSLVLKDGKTYNDVRIRKKLPDAVMILHKAGTATIPFEQLPDALVKKLGFDQKEVAEYRKTDEEKWQEEEDKLRNEMAKEELILAKKDKLKKLALEKQLANLVRPIRPAHGQIDRIIQGRVLNVLDDGILISIGQAGVCKVEMDSAGYVDDQIVSDIVELTGRRFQYIAVSGAKKTVPVYVPVTRKMRKYVEDNDIYLAARNAIESEISSIDGAALERRKDREALLEDKKKAFLSLHARHQSAK
ncbi:MAG: hypothetical protein H7A51_07845 [Akkermansiaceae bacterium]|nr:hypothetical protein [Akkermansiaceae bacterium]